ncbi:hypothetical protein CVV72_10840 [Amycolatopsis sp. TNS106]|nr:hypothetical protein CVV72_10840 [Amycolatopsis sp. TNS106]
MWFVCSPRIAFFRSTTEDVSGHADFACAVGEAVLAPILFRQVTNDGVELLGRGKLGQHRPAAHDVRGVIENGHDGDPSGWVGTAADATSRGRLAAARLSRTRQ